MTLKSSTCSIDVWQIIQGMENIKRENSLRALLFERFREVWVWFAYAFILMFIHLSVLISSTSINSNCLWIIGESENGSIETQIVWSECGTCTKKINRERDEKIVITSDLILDIADSRLHSIFYRANLIRTFISKLLQLLNRIITIALVNHN